MLSFFRKGIWAKLMLVILGIGLFAIVITGFGTGGVGGLDSLSGGSSTLARAAGERITAEEATATVQSQLKQVQAQQPGVDMATYLRGSALKDMIDQMVTAAARFVFGRDQGLAATKAMVDRDIVGARAFQNLAGQFDENVFRAALQQQGISEAQLRKELARTIIDRQLLFPVVYGIHVPDAMALQYASLLLESRTGILGVVPVEAMGGGVEPTDAEIAAFYRTNQARYTIPERRAVRYALFGAAQVAAQSKATDAEIAERYRRNAASYAPRETRNLSRVNFPTEAAARAFAAKIAGGTSFAAAATQAGFTPADTALADQDKAAFTKLSSAAAANAAFSAAKGAVTAPARTPFGWVVVRVDDVKTVPGRPLAAVRDELAAQIETDKRVDAISEMINRIDRSVGEGASLEEVARAEKLVIAETPPVTGNGVAIDNPAWTAPPELPALLRAVSGMTEEDDPLIETVIDNQVFALVQVARVVPAAPPPLAGIRDRVKADLVAKRQLDRARAVAAALVAKINTGTPPAQAFAQSDVRLGAPRSATLTRREMVQNANQPNSVPPELAMLFSLPQGKARLLAVPGGKGWFVVYLDKIVPGDARTKPDMIAGVRSTFAQIVGDEYGQQFTAAIQAGMEVERNDEAIENLRKQLTGQ